MKVFLTGATGYIGSAIAEELQAAGHTVVGLARTVEAEQKLKDMGMTPVRADLKTPDSLKSAVEGTHAVIHAGTTNDGRADADAVRALLDALAGSNRPLIYTSGCWLLGNTGDTPANETSPLNPPAMVAWRPGVERMVLDSAANGIRSIVIRPAMVYGRGGGVAGMFIQSANETGAARYIGDGLNRWAWVDVDDLADLYLLALEKAPAGTILHATDGDSTRTKDVAEAASFGAGLGGKTESWPIEQARDKMGPGFVEALLLDQVMSAEKAKTTFGWKPAAVSILEDLRYGSYAMARINP